MKMARKETRGKRDSIVEQRGKHYSPSSRCCFRARTLGGRACGVILEARYEFLVVK